MDEVVLSEYGPQWPTAFAEEAEALRRTLGENLVAVEHVGSTAIPGLAAKPVIDILAVVRSSHDGEQTVAALADLGYDYRGENGIPGRLFFRKGAVQYRRTHHLHLVAAGHPEGLRMLQFRDRLRAHPSEARRYEALKRELALRFRDNRAAYTDGKAEFIRAILERAAES